MKFLGNGDYDDNDNDADTSWLAPLCMNTFLRWRSVNIRDWLQLSVVDTKWENIQLRWLGSYDGWWRIRCANIHNYFTCVTMYLVMTRNKMVPYMYAQYFTEPEHPPPPCPGNNWLMFEHKGATEGFKTLFRTKKLDLPVWSNLSMRACYNTDKWKNVTDNNSILVYKMMWGRLMTL